MIKAIIFDFDGVLVESVDIKTKSFARLFESEGEEVVNKVINYHLQNGGMSRFDKFKYFYKNILHRQLTDEILSDLCKKFSELVVEEIIRAPYVKGAKEFLYKNVTNFNFFVCSATPQKEIETIIQKRKMSVYFNKVYGSPLSKSEIIQRILNNNNLSSQEIIFIGDSLSDYRAAKDKQVFFIARINNNEHLLKNNNNTCPKINDLSNLEDVIKDLSDHNAEKKNCCEETKKVYDFLSIINKEAYKDIFMLSNQVLSKNPYTNNFLINFLKNKPVKNISYYFIMSKLIRYYFFSFKNFFSYILEFFEYLFSGLCYQYNFNLSQMVLIDMPFFIPSIKRKDCFRDSYFPGLSEFLKKRNIKYCYLPMFDGMKKRCTIFNILKIFKKQNIPVITEYQLLCVRDLLYILFFILVYPLRVFKLVKSLDNNIYEQRLLRNELIETLDDITFMSFSRYLQGKKIASLPYKKIRVISWYENQVINKNLYRGLRDIPANITIYGAQLFTYSKNELNIVTDENEFVHKTLPDKILVNGDWLIPKNTKLNYAVGPSFRYSKIFTNKIENMDKRKKILISLSYHKGEAISILKKINVLKSCPYRLIVKPHPVTNIDDLRNFIPENVGFIEGDLYEIFKTARMIIGGATGTLVEAASLGIPAIFILNPDMINANPLPNYGKGIIWDEASNANELQTLIDKFESRLVANSDEIEDIARIYRENLFCKPEENNILKAFDL